MMAIINGLNIHHESQGEGPPIVFVHGLWQWQGIGTWRALRGSGVPYCLFPHGMLDPWFRTAFPQRHMRKVAYWKLIEHRVARHHAGMRWRDALARLGITHLAHRPVLEMSSGEAKRTLIARALVHDPHTLLFDEPGNTLDIAGQLELRHSMGQLARAGLGILLVTHHVSEIIPEIDRVVLLQKGKLLADGPKDLVLSSEQLSALFEVPVRLHREDGYFHLHA